MKKFISILDGVLFSLAFVLITAACYPFLVNQRWYYADAAGWLYIGLPLVLGLVAFGLSLFLELRKGSPEGLFYPIVVTAWTVLDTAIVVFLTLNTGYTFTSYHFYLAVAFFLAFSSLCVFLWIRRSRNGKRLVAEKRI